MSSTSKPTGAAAAKGTTMSKVYVWQLAIACMAGGIFGAALALA